MREKPELIASLQVGSLASGECSHCHEVILVKAASSGSEQVGQMLRQAFEEHVRGSGSSKKAISSNGNLD
jgi:hypothetical protein